MNAIRSMIRYAIKYCKYEKGSGLCDNGIIYKKNGANYVSKKGSVYRDHQSSSSYKRPSSSSSYNRSSNKSYTPNSTRESRNQAFSHQAIVSFYLSKDMKNDTNTIVNKGDKIKVLSCQNGSLGWCKIIYNGVIRYAYKSSLEKL